MRTNPPERVSWSVRALLGALSAWETGEATGSQPPRLVLPGARWNAAERRWHHPADAWRWDERDILTLFDSMRRGYPVGMLLLWQTDTTWRSRQQTVLCGRQRLFTLGHALAPWVFTPLSADDSRARPAYDLRDRRFFHLYPGAEAKSWHLPLSEVGDSMRFLVWVNHLPPSLERNDLLREANELVLALCAYEMPVCIASCEPEAREIRERLRLAEKKALMRSAHAER